jgi:hypothetical protein
MAHGRGDDLSGRGHGCPQNSILGLRVPLAAEAYSGRLDQQCGMEQEERWTAEGYRQPAYDYGSNVQRLDGFFQPRRDLGNVRRSWIDATGGNGAVLTRRDVRRAVVMSLARLLALVLRCERATVGFPRELAHVPGDDEHRREDQQPPGHESRIPGNLHYAGAYWAVPTVSRTRIAPSRMLPSGDRRAMGDVAFASLWTEPARVRRASESTCRRSINRIGTRRGRRSGASWMSSARSRARTANTPSGCSMGRRPLPPEGAGTGAPSGGSIGVVNHPPADKEPRA